MCVCVRDLHRWLKISLLGIEYVAPDPSFFTKNIFVQVASLNFLWFDLFPSVFCELAWSTGVAEKEKVLSLQ